MKKLYYAVAYYDEYMPCDRLQEDIRLMKAAGINLVRIAESTWSTLEPRPGVFDFSHIDRVLDAMHENEIDVIVGTPTYAIPSWMEKMHPEVIAETRQGRRPYGARQIMDITSPAYRFYCERVIRVLMEHVANHPAVVGYQIDNETKHYGTSGNNVQRLFTRWLRDKFGTTEEMNKAFGFDYWSNRVDAWEDVPDVRGTINGSYAAEFSKFQRSLVTEFLSWQGSIVREYAREDQFVTHNLDFDWIGHSGGIQPDVNHDEIAKILDVVGCDIYHPTQDNLTGIEIAQSGDQVRSLKQEGYLVLETQAQGFASWTPYPGQLRLQAMSHLASGAEMVEYWHWHSLHNAIETYWKGLLSHDFKPSAIYQEAVAVGAEFKKLSPELVNLHKCNKAAILVSNVALTALNNFPITGGMFQRPTLNYNGIVRWMYETLYRMNIGVDFVYGDSLEEGVLDRYDMVCVPGLYAASEHLLQALLDYEEKGGTLVGTFKTGFADENIKVYHNEAPHILSKAFGISYSQFTIPQKVSIDGIGGGCAADTWMELCIPEAGTEVLGRYDHPYWKQYAAVTKAAYGKGTGYYVATHCDSKVLEEIFRQALPEADKFSAYPVTVRQSFQMDGSEILFFLNYSMEEKTFSIPASRDLITGEAYEEGQTVTLGDWGYRIIKVGA